MLCNAPVSLGHVVLAHLKIEVRLGQHVSAQCLSHFTALFIVVGAETRNDSDNDTLIEDGSGMCWTSGPPGMSDHGPSKKSSEICEKTACRDACKGHQLRKKKNYVTSSGSQADVKSGINRQIHLELLALSSSCLLSVCLWLCLRVLLLLLFLVLWCVCGVWCETLEKPTVCRFKTSPCVPAPRPHVETHVRVVPANTVLNVHTRCMG